MHLITDPHFRFKIAHITLNIFTPNVTNWCCTSVYLQMTVEG